MNELERLRVENEALKNSLSKHYGLVFDYKLDTAAQQLFTHVPYLTSREDLGVNAEGVEHELVIGDNAHALTALLPRYREAVDVIYIDPPYNTGNKDFIYNDSFVDKEDPWRHSKWLSFMKTRLRLAKLFLKDTGVIFVSIDDNEQAQLKMLLDETFGEENHLATFIQEKGNSQNDSKGFQSNHEYVVTYRKSETAKVSQVEQVKQKVFKDEKGFYRKAALVTGGAGGVLKARPNLGYSFYYNPNTKEVIPCMDYSKEKSQIFNSIKEVYEDNYDLLNRGFIPIRPPAKKGLLGCWTWGYDKAVSEVDKIIITQGRNGYSVSYKRYVDSEKVIEENGDYYFQDEVAKPPRSIGSFPTSMGTKLLTQIIGGGFNNPKNLSLIQHLINLHPNQDAVVMDFFAGSGTAGHAVALLNAEDGGSRKAILVTNNENNIAENVTATRLQRALTGREWADGKPHPNLEQGLIVSEVQLLEQGSLTERDLVYELACINAPEDDDYYIPDEATLANADHAVKTWGLAKRRI